MARVRAQFHTHTIWDTRAASTSNNWRHSATSLFFFSLSLVLLQWNTPKRHSTPRWQTEMYIMSFEVCYLFVYKIKARSSSGRLRKIQTKIFPRIECTLKQFSNFVLLHSVSRARNYHRPYVVWFCFDCRVIYFVFVSSLRILNCAANKIHTNTGFKMFRTFLSAFVCEFHHHNSSTAQLNDVIVHWVVSCFLYVNFMLIRCFINERWAHISCVDRITRIYARYCCWMLLMCVVFVVLICSSLACARIFTLAHTAVLDVWILSLALPVYMYAFHMCAWLFFLIYSR